MQGSDHESLRGNPESFAEQIPPFTSLPFSDDLHRALLRRVLGFLPTQYGEIDFPGTRVLSRKTANQSPELAVCTRNLKVQAKGVSSTTIQQFRACGARGIERHGNCATARPQRWWLPG